LNRDGTDLFQAPVFANPAFGESNVLDCVDAAIRDAQSRGETLAPGGAAFLCADPDGFADIQVRNTTDTWAVDFSGMTVVDEQESLDEPYNPVIVGFRSAVAPNASINMNWVNSLFEREINQGSTFVLDDRYGRIHFRNVDTVNLGEFLGCDPESVRINVQEIEELLRIGSLPEPTLEEFFTATALINRFRCTLNQTPKDITVLGWAVTTIESDRTPTNTTRGAVNDALDDKRAEMTPQIRSLGTKLATLRTNIRNVIQFCNDTATLDGYSLECMSRFANIDLQLKEGARTLIPTGGGSIMVVLNAIGSIVTDIISCAISACDADDPIGTTALRTYLAVSPDFMTLLVNRLPGGSLPGGTLRLANESYNVATFGDGARYETAGRTLNFTEELKTTRLASERARNAGRCPWLPPPESSNTGVTL
jgi:hypothetical protein